jgi:hypothetical protein
MIYLYHQDLLPSLKVIEPLYGIIPRSYYCFMEQPVEGTGHIYLAKLNKRQALYDIGADPNNFIDKLDLSAHNITETLHQYIKGAGFYGFYNSRSILPHVVGLYYPHPVKYITDSKQIFAVVKGVMLQKSEEMPMQKKLRDVVAAGAIAFSGAGERNTPKKPDVQPLYSVPASLARPTDVELDPPKKFDKNRTLKAIKMVESSNGKNTNHEMLENGPHKGTNAIGSYGLMPMTVKEMVSKNKRLKEKYGDSLNLDNDAIHEYVKNKPGMEDELAGHYYDQIKNTLGTDDIKVIGYSWLNGIEGARQAMADKKDLSQHWHVRKLSGAYDKLNEHEENRHQANLKKNVAMSFIVKSLCR